MNGISSLLNDEPSVKDHDSSNYNYPQISSTVSNSSSKANSHSIYQSDSNEVQIKKDPALSLSNLIIPSASVKRPINKSLLQNKNLIKLAIRKKSTTRRSSRVSPDIIQPNSITSPTSPKNSKSHFKPLEAGSRIRLTLVPSLTVLYLALVPHTIRKDVKIMLNGPNGIQDATSELFKNDVLRSFSSALVSKPVKLIDDNLMNLSSISSKVLQSLHQNEHVPTFNSMDAAVSSLFGLKEYTAVRVTRAASSEPEGSILLKLETATPGDDWLIDDEDYSDDMLGSLGIAGDRPNSAFIKKVIARPRYKSDMKIYILPRNVAASLYVEERMLERDLIKGIVDLENQNRVILCSFDYGKVIEDYKKLVYMSNNKENDKVEIGPREETDVVKAEESDNKKRKIKGKGKSTKKKQKLPLMDATPNQDLVTHSTHSQSFDNGSTTPLSNTPQHLQSLPQQHNSHSPYQQQNLQPVGQQIQSNIQSVHVGHSVMVPYMIQVQPVYYYQPGANNSYQSLPPPPPGAHCSVYNYPQVLPSVQNLQQNLSVVSNQNQIQNNKSENSYQTISPLPPLNPNLEQPPRICLPPPNLRANSNYQQHQQQLPSVQNFLLPPLTR